ncbi:MAG: SDR family oxidoreductase [Paenibacillaceae bacterium]|uniref:SDR family oxidoreductase n=1 Tax=Paenibacillus mellifer TaxID=2937794 RepID=A0A9X2BTX7_9BACL|nr:SDR family oxidoreductase [Paenibacillus mellifer]MBW4839840.1 SDR family oxidoreductase [Paenibacillaceae bacterium]MCK8489935.1 SDR family oxidoreductase [Paenibacillus mellifer]
MSLAGKVALVTGAGTGIGQGIAIEMANRGARMALHYNRSEAGVLETKRRIDEAGGDSFIVRADVSNPQEIAAMVRHIESRAGDIDILVNNAAVQLNYDLFKHDGDTFDRMFDTNVKGYWQCIQAVIPGMKQKGTGRIILISSVHAKRPTDFDPVYAMTKGAIRMLGRESAIELAPYGITVNTIEPGAVDVGKYNLISPDDPDAEKKREARRKHQLEKFPLGRVGLPLDVAHLACFIASNESEYMTGSAIRLDGGSMLL